jgi:hypothetical protein
MLASLPVARSQTSDLSAIAANKLRAIATFASLKRDVAAVA